MRQIPPLVDKRILTPAQAALALELVDQVDLLGAHIVGPWRV